MSTHESTDELRARYIAAMGSALGEVHHELLQESTALQLKWDEYIQLFGTNPERIDLVNRAAAAFFYVVDETLWESVVMHICRLTDPASSGKDKENLTVQQLPALVSDAIRPDVKTLIDEALKRSEFARDWRNRRIGHLDLALALNRPEVKPLEPATGLMVIKFLESLVALLNAVSTHYGMHRVMFDVFTGPGNGLELLVLLRDGLDARDEWRKQLARGELRLEDYPRKPPL